MLPVVESERGLASLISLLLSRVTAERIVPEFTTKIVDDLGLRVVEEDGVQTLDRE
jgi:hypothetical protein